MSDGASMEMPRYRCHKEVWALKIAAIRVRASDGRYFLEFADTRYAPREISAQYVIKHSPQEGGYFGVYKDEYDAG